MRASIDRDQVSRTSRGYRERFFHLSWAAALVCLAWPGKAGAQSCAEPKASDFQKTTLLSGGLDRPVQMAIAPDGRIFIGEMATGAIKVYKPGQIAPVDAGVVPTRFLNEDGLLGVALPPDFASSQFLYVLATDPDNINRSHVLWRYKLNGDKLDAATKTEILRIPRQKGGLYHAAGGLHIDKKGNLWISTGDDSNPHSPQNSGFGSLYTNDPGSDAQKSSSNTNDLRGKIIRIHPEAALTDGKWYTIPAGNLNETMGSFWNAADLAKVRPEIFAFGMRNPFRFTVDDQTGWLLWGEVGPDANSDSPTRGRGGHDEFNVAMDPGFYGWPYCIGNQYGYNAVDYANGGKIGDKYDCANLTNTSPNNTGVQKLPPARAPIIWYGVANKTDFIQQMGTGNETAIGGPMYRFDNNLKSASKFPAQYDGRWLIIDWYRHTHKFITLTKEGKLDKWFDFLVTGMNSDIGAEYGPDGALYVLQYSQNAYSDNKAALYLIAYTGPHDCAVSLAKGATGRPGSKSAMVSGFQPITLPADAEGLEVFDLSGRKAWTYVRNGAAGALRIELPKGLALNLLRVRFM
ncbi:MAG: PQQ-dependent sugar dehydrogenase [Fibrobacteria bacterium]